jgi:GntR family transcriptional regulator/MocR family aminotransferase
MWDRLVQVDPSAGSSLQSQIREALVSAILDGHVSPDLPLPSSRRLAQMLGIGRNTVVLAYQHLEDEGYLTARERSGYFVNPNILSGRVSVESVLADTSVDWPSRFRLQPSTQRNIVTPRDWRNYPYPFLYAQPDDNLMPLSDWRECCREGLSVQSMRGRVDDWFDFDDPMLVKQIQTRLLPRRGVFVSRDEILVTMGAQNALYLIAELLVGESQTVGIEEPGYPDARNIFASRSQRLRPLAVDSEGLIVDPSMDGCDLVYVTPSHQSPTMVTMSLQRRQALLEAAERQDLLLVEDDYESESNFLGDPTAALKSMDRSGRVLYVGSLSKTLAPGLRMGFLVASAELIREARALRRLVLRHPPANNERTLALFLSQGYHDALICRLSQVYRARWHAMKAALDQHLPMASYLPSSGGSAFWVRGPAGLCARELQKQAARRGVLIEPGDVHFLEPNPPHDFFRLGFSAVPEEHIEPGIRLLAEALTSLSTPSATVASARPAVERCPTLYSGHTCKSTRDT